MQNTAAAEATTCDNHCCDTNLNLCCGSTLGKKSCTVVGPLVCLNLVNIASVDGVTGSQDVHDVLRLRCRTLQPKRNCRHHNAVIKWTYLQLVDCTATCSTDVQQAMRYRRGTEATGHICDHRRSAGARDSMPRWPGCLCRQFACKRVVQRQVMYPGLGCGISWVDVASLSL